MDIAKRRAAVAHKVRSYRGALRKKMALHLNG